MVILLPKRRLKIRDFEKLKLILGNIITLMVGGTVQYAEPLNWLLA